MLNFALSSNTKDVASHFSSTVRFSAHVFDTFVLVNVHTRAGSHSIAHSTLVDRKFSSSYPASLVSSYITLLEVSLLTLSSVVFPILY